MPIDRRAYPVNWAEISLRIRQRAGNRCEWCGAENHQPHPLTGAYVVLTVAHVENEDPMDCRDENLAALCQRCHNRHDGPMRARHAAATRREKRRRAARKAGQREMWDFGEPEPGAK